MQNIEIFALGAGQDVGRSCVVVTIKDKKIIFDTGIHMLYSDEKRYPNFQLLKTQQKDINNIINLVLITHFHLDHCGAIPYLTQKHKYNGPIYASTPTKAMIPYMLEDFRKVTVDLKKQDNSSTYSYTQEDIKESVSKINSIGLNETIIVDDIKITCYYAGHVLGAAMFFVEYDGLSVLYTGDYNSYADRHLGAAYTPRLNPNIVITETTYATTIRDTKRDRQRKMLKIVTETLEKGGKVLIPVFALGRAQQLSVLLETYWNRTDNKNPVYFSAGLIEKANFYYKLFVQWQNQKIKESFLTDNIFEFKKVKPFQKSLIRSQTPYVLFATPGMLHGGTSMQVFKEWCGDSKNTLIIPGYCVAGTLGNKLLNGVKEINIDKKQYQVNMRIQNISFSAHADAKGIIGLLRHLNPENIVFVHGDKIKMEQFAEIVSQQLSKKVYMPANFVPIKIPSSKIYLSKVQFQECLPYEGYFLKYNNVNKLISEQNLLSEVNHILNMVQNKQIMIIDTECHCRLSIGSDKVDINQLNNYNQGKINYQHLKQELKEQMWEIKQEAQQSVRQLIVQGNLEQIINLIKEK